MRIPAEIDVETSLADYTRSLRMHGQALFALVKRDTPVETWRITGYEPHYVIITKCFGHDAHDEVIEAHAKNLLDAGLKPFAIAANEHEGWEVCHYGRLIPEDEAVFGWDEDEEEADGAH